MLIALLATEEGLGIVLHEKVAIVTGAASGIGLAITNRFAEEGARVIATDRSAERLQALGGADSIVTTTADVSNRADVERMIALAIERFGRIDILCNNAGIIDNLLPVGELTDEVWNRILAVNLTGPMMSCRAAIPHMLQQGGGVIINISSIGGLFGARGGAAYAASKHGLIGLTRNIAVTYGKDGIRCVAVCPGAVTTAIGQEMQPSQRGMEALSRTYPANPRSADPVEIANVCVFLASDQASFVNGAAIVADGGWTAH